MSNQTLNLNPSLYQYLLDVSLREPLVLKELRNETARLPECNMQIAPEQGQFMQLLVRLTGAKRIIEVGTFTGYSALAMALAVSDEGQLICCDVNAEWTAIAQRYWQQAGVADKIRLELAPAVETLQKLVEAKQSHDLVFLDADKENYQNYYELALQLLKPGGLVVIDNTLWDGNVINPEDQEPSTCAIRAFNEHLHQDSRVDIAMLPLADGVTLARKKEQR